MKRPKSSIAFILALAMLFSLSVSCSSQGKETSKPKPEGNGSSQSGDMDPFGKYDEPVTLRIGQSIHASTVFPDGESPEDNRYTRLLKDELNINIEVMWQVGSQNDYDQKMNLAIASNDLPDAAVVDKTQFRAMAKSQQLEDMTDVVPNYASDAMNAFFETTNGEAMEAATYDGRVMAMPGVQADADGYHMMWIRKDWVDALGMEIPKTVEDIQAVAKAFVDHDMSGDGKTIGVAGPHSGDSMYATFLESTNRLYGFDPIFSAYHAYPGYWLEQDGQAVYGSVQPETKQALAKLQEMYAAGLIDPEMCVRKDSAEPIIAGQTGIFFAPWWMGYSPIPDAVRTDEQANWQAYAAPLDDSGNWTPHAADTTGKFTVVRKGYEHPEAVIKLSNLVIREEPNMDLDTLGIEVFPLRNMQSTTDEVQVTTKAVQDYLAGETEIEDLRSLMDIYVSLESDLNSAKTTKLEPYDNLDIEYWNSDVEDGSFGRLYSMLVGAGPLVNTEIHGVKSIIYNQTDTMQKKWSNLKKMEDEIFLKIVTGAVSIDEFDTFVEDWKKQGGSEITEEVLQTLQ